MNVPVDHVCDILVVISFSFPGTPPYCVEKSSLHLIRELGSIIIIIPALAMVLLQQIHVSSSRDVKHVKYDIIYKIATFFYLVSLSFIVNMANLTCLN